MIHRSAVVIVILMLLIATGCGGGRRARDTSDAELSQANVAARRAFERGDIAQAEVMYERALRRGRIMDRPSAISDAAYNLALCRIELESFDQVDALLLESRRECARLDRNCVDILLLQAEAARLQGNDAQAMAQVRLLLGLASLTPLQRAQANLVQGHIQCQQGDLPAARASLKRASSGRMPAAMRAEIAGLQAKILQQEGSAIAAARQFDEQAALLRSVRRYRSMSTALAHAGQAYAAGGEPSAAAERYWRAHRSALAGNDLQRAAQLAEKSMQLAQQAGESELLQLLPEAAHAPATMASD